MEDHGKNVDLPRGEIIYEILSRLPVKSLCRFKCVSKPWRSLISDPDFVANYFKLALENKDVFRRRGRLIFNYCGHPNRVYSLNVDQFLNENHNVNVDGLVATPSELDFVYKHLPEGHRWVPGLVHYFRHGLSLPFVVSKGNGTLSVFNPVTKESKTLPQPPDPFTRPYSDLITPRMNPR